MTRRLSCRFFHQGSGKWSATRSNRSGWFSSFQDFARIPAQDRHILESLLLEPLVDFVGELGLDLDADDAALGRGGRALEKRQTPAKTDV